MEVQGFPNYTIADDGTITNIHTGRVLSSHVNTQTGYKCVSLWKDNKEKRETIHRLLATHFIPNPDNKPYIDHIDRNKLNNALSNLRWVNGTENNLNSGGQDRDLHNIYYRKDRNVYRVWIQRYAIIHRLGQFKTIEEAKKVRDEWYVSNI
jgi:hypothetical protein